VTIRRASNGSGEVICLGTRVVWLVETHAGKISRSYHYYTYVAQENFLKLAAHLKNLVVGQEALLSRMLVALLCDGHPLVEGAPGLAKTRAIKVLSHSVERDFHRLQFTSDLLPADLTGAESCEPARSATQATRKQTLAMFERIL